MMYDTLWNLSDAGAIGCKLINTDGSVQTSCIQSFPTLLNQLLDSNYLRRRMPMSKLWGTRALYESPTLPIPVDMISGACTLVKKNVFELVGQFSPEYFMYAEDMDLCFKMKKAGYKVYYTNRATVIHHGSSSSKKSEVNHFAAQVMRESMQKFMRKSRGRLYGALYRASMSVVAILRSVLISILIVATPNEYRRNNLKMSRGKWMAILRWSLGFEKWTRRLSHEKSEA